MILGQREPQGLGRVVSYLPQLSMVVVHEMEVYGPVEHLDVRIMRMPILRAAHETCGT